jgi:hypothetical protein
MGRPLGAKNIRWSQAMRRTFLDHLAATGNVHASAAAIDVHENTIYALRRRDPAFVAAWDEALKLGYQMLETRLLGHVLAGGTATGKMDQGAFGTLDANVALSMLSNHRAAMAGRPPRGLQSTPKRATREETNAALLTKLDAIDKRNREKQA